MEYDITIGLEIHCQLATDSKLFAADANLYGGDPNTHISVITLAHPGVLPKVNEKAVAYAIRMGLACGSQIARYTYFDRKNYFYPDLPKGYQTSQDKYPICVGGSVPIRLKEGKTFRHHAVQLHHIHLEEDAGKSIHEGSDTLTFLDYNRAGTPLIEIVSEPCITSSEEAGAYVAEVRKLVRYLGICDGNMEEGSMRADLNISIRPKGQQTFGTKVEIKNMNSIRNLQRAVDYEVERQKALLEAGQPVLQETRMFDAATGQTHGMRMKETMNDYRYFPEPDLSPIQISEEELADARRHIPALPQQLFEKYVQEYGISEEHAHLLTEDKEWSDYFNRLTVLTPHKKAAASWLVASVRGILHDHHWTLNTWPVADTQLAELIDMVENREISHSAASQQLLPKLAEHPGASPREVAKTYQLLQNSNTDSLQKIVEEVLAKMAPKVAEYKKGKKGLLGLFVGEVMKASKGAADPKKVNELLLAQLDG